MFVVSEKFSQMSVVIYKTKTSVKNKCLNKESVDNSSLVCPMDGQTFKKVSRAETLEVSCSNILKL